MSNWGGTPRECDHGKYPKPTWPQFLIYKIKGCEKIASGDKSMGMVSVWRQEGTNFLARVASSEPISPGNGDHLKSTGWEFW